MPQSEGFGMLGDTLDPQFESALSAIAKNDWSAAREILAMRLDETESLGRRRLNLYLLSVVAAEAGHQDTGEQLAQMAQATPIELNEPRYLGRSDNDALYQLELGWWSFNGWTGDPLTFEQPAEVALQEIPWADILDAVLEGRAGELERRYQSQLEGDQPERPLFWNLVALAYLEQGDPRTYDEMRQQAPPAADAPPNLLALLQGAGLKAAVRALEQKRWLTAELLEMVDHLESQDPATSAFDSSSCHQPVPPNEAERGLFWENFQSALAALREGEPGSARSSLRELICSPLAKTDHTHSFLVALLFCGAAILGGDTVEAQESFDDAVRQAEAGPLDSGTLGLAQQRCRAAGVLTIAEKLSLEALSTLDPWRDFPADFQVGSASEF